MLTSDKITEIFFIVDEYCQHFDKNISSCIEKLSSSTDKFSRNKPCSLSTSEMITIQIAFQSSGYRTLKHFYLEHVCQFWKHHFPKLVSYNRFVELQRSNTLQHVMFVMSNCIGECSGISFIDSTKLAVCKNQRIHQHKQFKNIAQRGHTSTGWFYGFKLHLIMNDKGEIISFQLTKGNVSDNNENLLLKLCKDIFGKLYGDKGYIVKHSVFEKLFYDGVQIITKIRKNMKNSLMSIYDKIMLRKRSVIECLFDNLKNVAQLEHSRHRSLHGFILNVFSAIAAYHFTPKKPSIYSEFQTINNSLQLTL
jgi:hypothetical protein